MVKTGYGQKPDRTKTR